MDALDEFRAECIRKLGTGGTVNEHVVNVLSLIAVTHRPLG